MHNICLGSRAGVRRRRLMRPRAACAILRQHFPLSLDTIAGDTLRPEAVRPARRRPAWAARGLAIVAWLARLASRPRSGPDRLEVQVTPETMTLGVGQKQTIFAAAYDRQGNLISSAKFTFWSSDTLDRPGLERRHRARASAPGSPRSRRGCRASARRWRCWSPDGRRPTVARRRRRLALDPTTRRPAARRKHPITPQALREDGTPLPLGRVTWKSLKPEIATVDSTGLWSRRRSGQEHRAGERRGRAHGHGAGRGRAGGLRRWTERRGPRTGGGRDPAGPRADAGQSPDHHRPPMALGRQRRGRRRADGIVAGAAAGPDRDRGDRLRPGAAGRSDRASPAAGRSSSRPSRRPRRSSSRSMPPGSSRAVAEAADSTPIPEARITWELGDTDEGLLRPRHRHPHGPGHRRHDAHARASVASSRWSGGSTSSRGFSASTGPASAWPSGERVTLAASLLDEAGKVIAPATGVEWGTDRPEVAAVSGGEVRGDQPGPRGRDRDRCRAASATADVFVTADLLRRLQPERRVRDLPAAPDSPDTLLPRAGRQRRQHAGGALARPDADRVQLEPRRQLTTSTSWTPTDATPAASPPTPAARAIRSGLPTDRASCTPPRRAPALPQIMSIRPDGGDPRRSPRRPAAIARPDVSPDGRRVAFVSTRDGNPEIYEVGIDGGEAAAAHQDRRPRELARAISRTAT